MTKAEKPPISCTCGEITKTEPAPAIGEVIHLFDGSPCYYKPIDMEATATTDVTMNSIAPYDFPPRTIKEWVEHHTVSTRELAAELRLWADWMEQKTK